MNTKGPLFIKILNRVYQITIEDVGFRTYVYNEFQTMEKPQRKPAFSVYFLNEGDGQRNRRTTSRAFVMYKNIPQNAYPLFEFFLKVVIELSLLKHKVFFLHASSISLEGRGVVFSGPIGAGKTTTLLNCEKHLKTKTYSEDTALIQCKDHTPYLHPSPFDKRSDISLPAVPLGEIYLLHHSRISKTRRIKRTSAIQSLLDNNLLFQYYHPKKMYYKRRPIRTSKQGSMSFPQYKLLLQNANSIAKNTTCSDLFLSLGDLSLFLPLLLGENSIFITQNIH